MTYDYDRSVTAAKNPLITALNRALRGIKTNVIKWLNSNTDLVWSAGSTYDYIGIGSTVSFFGAPNTEQRWTVRCEVNFSTTSHDPDSTYLAIVKVYGGQRQLEVYSVKDKSLNELKRNAGQLLFTQAKKAITAFLSGSSDREVTRLKDELKEAHDSLSKAEGALKKLDQLVGKTKDPIADAESLIRAFREAESAASSLKYPLQSGRNLVEEMARGGR